MRMGLWPFKQSKIVSDGMAEWHREKFAWLVEEFGEKTAFNSRTLVLPDAQTFRSGGKSGHELACQIFEQIKALAGVPHFEAELIATNETLPEYDGQNIARPTPMAVAAGTFSVPNGNSVVITYEAKLLKEPMRLVATLAHELAHYVLATSSSKWPVDEEDHEFLTDLTAIFLGFGIFQSNSAFEFSQFSDGNMQGWQTQRLGYLPQNDMVYATALFIKAKGIAADSAYKYLKPSLGKLLRKALASV